MMINKAGFQNKSYETGKIEQRRKPVNFMKFTKKDRSFSEFGSFHVIWTDRCGDT